MTALFFVLAIVAMFAVVVAAESDLHELRPQLIQTGLLKWLVSGNWPAKVGAGLLLLGVGALLRFALDNIDLPPALKLGSGLLIAAALAAAAFVLRDNPKRRAIHLALAGASAGVAYLTAYAAYGFFHYVSDFNALAMLALVAVVTGVFAVTSGAMSIGILAMAGAYIAPAFALDVKAGGPGPGPAAVYGYYVAISALSLVMVSLRGWRGLIHLSFLFTLAGAVFFGWTAKYFRPEHYAVMQPLLLALVAIHLAMPLVERRHLPSRWLSRFDVGYFVALPLFSVALTMLIAPYWRTEGVRGLLLLAAIWGVAAATLKVLKRDEAFRHALVSVLLLVAAILCQLDDVPWLLFGLGMSVAALAIAPRMAWSRSTQELFCGGILLFGLLHALSSLLEPATSQVAFVNVQFGKRLIAAAMIGIGAGLAWRRTLTMAKLLSAMAVGWLLLAVANELRLFYMQFVPQVVYAALLAIMALIALGHRWFKVANVLPGLLVVALTLCGWWSVHEANWTYALICLLLTPAVLLGLIVGRTTPSRRDDGATICALALLPFAMVPWAHAVFAAAPGSTEPVFMAAIFVTAGVLASWWLAPRWQPKNATVDGALRPTHFLIVVAGLLWVSLFHIERNAPAVVFELLGAAYLLMFATGRDSEGKWRSTGYITTAVIAVALIMQAMLLRWLGPDLGSDGVLTVADLSHMKLPAVVSLMYAILGGGLTWWGTKRISRPIWAAGSILLVASALKLVLLDFESLGDLRNILALIAAGLVFMGVAWFAPIPPKPIPPPEPVVPPTPTPAPRTEQTRPRPTPPPIPPAPVAAPVAPAAASAEPSADAISERPNRAVFPAPPPLVAEESEKKNEPVTPPKSIAERASNAAASTASAPIEDDVKARIGQAAQTVSAQRPVIYARESKSDGSGRNVIIILALVVAAIWGLRLSRPHNSQPASYVPSAAESVAAREAAESGIRTGPDAPPARQPAPYPAGSSADEANAFHADACASFSSSLHLPDSYRLLAASASGRPLGLHIDQSGYPARRVVVEVNSPREPVVLMLGAFAPTIWKINRSAGTQVLAVLVSGYNAQQLEDADSGLPSLISTRDNGAPCGYFYQFYGASASVRPVALKAFGRAPDQTFEGTDTVRVGDPEIADSAGVAGDASAEIGFDDAVRKGVLRAATDSDWLAWASAVAQDPERLIEPQGHGGPGRARRYSGYVVLASFTIPTRIYSNNVEAYLVPLGVPIPRGNPGASMIMAFNDFECAKPRKNLRCPKTKTW